MYQVLIYLCLWKVLYSWFTAHPVMLTSTGNIQVSDFVYYVIFARAFWFENLSDLYSSSAYLQVLPTIVGNAIPVPMPLGISPIALVLLFPFAMLSYLSFEIAQAAWVAFSLQLLGYQSLLVFRRLSDQGTVLKVLIGIAACIFVGSTTMVVAISHGQTSIFATGALLFIFLNCFGLNPSINSTAMACEKSFWGQHNYLTIFAFIALAVKPQYFAIALCMLLLSGNRRTAFLGATLAATLTILVSLKLNISWIHDYMSGMSVFSSGDIPKNYRHAFAPTSMNLFSSAFTPYLGQRLCMTVSNVVSTITFVSIIAIASLPTFFERLFPRLTTLCENSRGVVVCLGAYLLFMPYAGSYEDLLLWLLLSITLISQTSTTFQFKNLSTLILLLYLLLNHTRLSFLVPKALLWVAKLAFVLLAGREVFGKKKKRPSYNLF